MIFSETSSTFRIVREEPRRGRTRRQKGGACEFREMRTFMKTHLFRTLMAIALAAAVPALIFAGVGPANAQTNEATGPTGVMNPNGIPEKLELTPAQRSAIYDAVRKDKSKVAPSRFSTTVGAEVPPMIELYMLPDDILAQNPAAKFYKYTVVQDRVVLVDPTNMRIVAVIGSPH
jgi:Protein of unknown function (DUF1236)